MFAVDQNLVGSRGILFHKEATRYIWTSAEKPQIWAQMCLERPKIISYLFLSGGWTMKSFMLKLTTVFDLLDFLW